MNDTPLLFAILDVPKMGDSSLDGGHPFTESPANDESSSRLVLSQNGLGSRDRPSGVSLLYGDVTLPKLSGPFTDRILGNILSRVYSKHSLTRSQDCETILLFLFVSSKRSRKSQKDPNPKRRKHVLKNLQ